MLEENIQIKKQILEKFSNLIDQGDFILGKEVSLFEEQFSKKINAVECVTTSSGTSALILAIKSLNLSNDDEVILPAHTFISTALAVHAVNAKIVLCDIDPTSFNISITDLKRKITSKTKAIIPVHLYGQMAEIGMIMNLAKEKNIFVIEDASQAHGATQNIDGKTKSAGTVGNLGCFSFYPTKNLGAFGDAGAIVASTLRSMDTIRAIRNYGQFEKNVHKIIGDNARMDSLQAIVLTEKLTLLDELNEKRKQVALRYDLALKSSSFIIPSIIKSNSHVYHQYVVKCNHRDKHFSFLKENGISVAIHYPTPIHLHPCFEYLGYRRGDFPNAENICDSIISLPIYPSLNQSNQDIIIALLLESQKLYE